MPGPAGLDARPWPYFDGTMAPAAGLLQAACTCGWRGSTGPIGWGQEPESTEKPFREEWTTHARRAATGLADRLLRELQSVLQGLAATDPRAALTAAADMERASRLLLTESADAARSSGDSWAQVGRAVGISRQAAHERFGKPPK
ncbi:hypothetical protein [Streptomyces sp. MS2.AVA.5]|uniref:Uncharacterized protein n=1 Tax=Streptomyces achmelvichensis TaxID=3134111 RepID=A0ACC6PLI8_9ACTN